MARPVKQKSIKGTPKPAHQTSSDTITDPRFSNIQTSALYRLPSKKQNRAKLDSRFSRVLQDERFATKAKVDRYGRSLATDKGRDLLDRLYDPKDEAVESETPVIGNEDNELDDDELVQQELRRVSSSYDPARDGGFSESSSEDESSDEEEIAIEEVDYPGQQTRDAPTGEVSRRLAVVNLDWDNVRAIDLLAVFSSFVPEGERILNVAIYPSEFGKERMEREEIEGPPKEIYKSSKLNSSTREEKAEVSDDEDLEDEEAIKRALVKPDEGEEFDANRLRKYQLERLRYYYSVLSCSSKKCAESIYHAVDGTEYLATANFFDLRFIPEDMDFSENKPRDVADQLPDKYKPNDFVTSALRHSKVKLTWDADDTERKEAQKRAFTGSRAELDENDLQAYLGSDSSEDEDGPSQEGAETGVDNKQSQKENERQKLRQLLGLDQKVPAGKSREQAHVGDMQVTFSSALGGSGGASVFENEPSKDETTIEAYVRKEKERKKKRKERMKASKGEHEVVVETVNTKDQGEETDLGFDDPFFTAPAGKGEVRSKSRQKEKGRKESQLSKETEDSLSNQAELELLMLDESHAQDINHFDMKEIERAEKKSRTRKGKGKLSARDREALDAKDKDQFAINVSDPRFNAVYEQNEFAVDPGHPRFKGTEGMKALLEETRRKRQREVGSPKAEAGQGRKTKTARLDPAEDVSKLVDRVKGRTKTRAA